MEKNNEMSKKVLGLNLDQKLTELMDLKKDSNYSRNNGDLLIEISDLAGAYGVKNVDNYMVDVIDACVDIDASLDGLRSEINELKKMLDNENITHLSNDIKYLEKKVDSLDEKTDEKLQGYSYNNAMGGVIILPENKVKNGFLSTLLLGADNNGEIKLISGIYNTIINDMQKNTSDLSKRTFKYKGKIREYLELSKQMYSMEPVKTLNGQTHYSTEQLGELLNTKLPARITKNGRWSNNLNHISEEEAIYGLAHPTHILQYTPTSESNIYKFNTIPFDPKIHISIISN
jgi:hypothetical protein